MYKPLSLLLSLLLVACPDSVSTPVADGNALDASSSALDTGGRDTTHTDTATPDTVASHDSAPTPDGYRSDTNARDDRGNPADALSADAQGPDPHTCDPTSSLFVAKDGADNSGCGSSSQPCLSIRVGLANAQAATGRTVCVRPGVYAESWLEVPAGVWLKSTEGPGATSIYSGTSSAVRLSGADNIGIQGFSIHGERGAGQPGDGLVRVLDASAVTIRNNIIFDAPMDQDCIKVSGDVSQLLIEGNLVYNPGPRASGPCSPCYQENIDIFGRGESAGAARPVSDIVVRGNWVFHTAAGGDWLIYSKIYSERIIYEGNVFGPSSGLGFGNAAVGIGTGEPSLPDSSAATVVDAIVRNNLFTGLRGDAAFAVMNADNTWVYNNLFYANSGPDLRSVVMFRGNSHPVGPTHMLNNVFVNNHPAQNGATFYWVRDGLPTTWTHDHNLYHDNITTSDTAYTGENNSLYDSNPQLVATATPTTTDLRLARIAEILETAKLSPGSSGIDQGKDVLAIPEHPNWRPAVTARRIDAFTNPRPSADTWDLGLHELSP